MVRGDQRFWTRFDMSDFSDDIQCSPSFSNGCSVFKVNDFDSAASRMYHDIGLCRGEAVSCELGVWARRRARRGRIVWRLHRVRRAVEEEGVW